MLQLKNITKTYDVADAPVQALQGVTIDFRESEFVSILGPSGCGKTTLLNIIGGLDRYTEGDLMINGRSTKDFKESDWDTYRNHSVGFVFQSYNLIPHQTVLSNVELALTLSGVSKAERKRRAIEALEKVGLGNQLKKKPNQMSGGQMQRVAIARAIVNDPDILLADEPTGALDTATSVQIMDILRDIAKDKLVIMVTHNPQLAEEYSTRIVRLLDGRVLDDSMPYEATSQVDRERKTSVKKEGRASMSFRTALSLSLNNLMTKKGRSAMTAFAGSVGIIGIALILCLSNGINAYIDSVQKDTLSSYPIQIEKQTMDMTRLMTTMMTANQGDGSAEQRDPNLIYSNNILSSMLSSAMEEITVNNLKDFKSYVDEEPIFADRGVVSAVQYGYDLNLNIYTRVPKTGQIVQVNPSEIMSIMLRAMGMGNVDTSTSSSLSSMYGLNMWTEMLDNQELLDAQYELLDPNTMHWPRNYDEIVIVVNDHNELSDVALYALGLKDPSEFRALIADLMAGKKVEADNSSYSYEDLMNLSYRILLPTDRYVYDEAAGVYVDQTQKPSSLEAAVDQGIELKVTGLIRAREGAVSTSIDGTVAYTHALTEYVAKLIEKSDLMQAQLASPTVNVLDGLPFDVGQYDHLTPAEQAALFRAYASSTMKPSEKQRIMLTLLVTLSEEEREALLSSLSEEDRALLLSTDHSKQSQTELVYFILSNYTLSESVTRSITVQMFKAYMAQIPGGEAYLEQMAGMTEEEIWAWINSMSQEKPGMPTKPADPEESLQMAAGLLEQLDRDTLLGYASALDVELLLQKLTDAGNLTSAQYEAMFDAYLKGLDDQTVAATLYETYMPALTSTQSYDQVMTLLGFTDLDNPSRIYLYAASFEGKDQIQSLIQAYNDRAEAEDREEDVIEYTDMVGLMMSFFTDLVNAISYVLIAFVSISLVVSSIMIGIITYISVLERTKEIGVLRAMGASRRDVGRVFNAETMLIGLTSGLFGILTSALLCLPINGVIRTLTGIPNLTASLPWVGGVILVLVSVVMTLIAGLIPSVAASKKDPVVALRSE